MDMSVCITKCNHRTIQLKIKRTIHFISVSKITKYQIICLLFYKLWFVLQSSPLSSVRQNIIVTIIIVWYSSLTDTDVLDLLVQDEDLEELLLSLSCPFVFHSGMNCLVVSCGFSSFKTKKSYSRHSETRQKPHHIIIYCSIPRCKSTCRRKTDMR